MLVHWIRILLLGGFACRRPSGQLATLKSAVTATEYGPDRWVHRAEWMGGRRMCLRCTALAEK